MPQRLATACSFPRCAAITRDRYCTDHTSQKYIQYKDRTSSSKRGYGGRWAKYRLTFLKDNPLCVHCLKEGRTEPARVVDHIVPAEGPTDPNFYLTENHQALCISCHNRKTAGEQHVSA